jgi:transposase
LRSTASSRPTTPPSAACARAVIYRKLSLGSQSEQGERMIERLLSVSTTCRLQRRSLFAYLADALTAKTRGEPPPLLT